MRVYASAEMTLTDTNDGISVTGIDRYYMASSSSSGITVDSQGWQPDPQETNPISRYHWSYEVVKYSDGAKIPSKPAVIGVYGKEGADAVTVSLSSEAHTFAGTESKAIASSITIDVYAFKGAQRMPTSIGTVTGGISGQLTHSELGRGTTSNKLVINTTSALDKSHGTLSISIVTDGKTFNKVFSWSVAFKGKTGDKGDTGPQGPRGVQGPSGSNGQSQWVHIRYSANSNGSSMTPSPSSTTKYVGIAVTNSATAPTYTEFTWSKYVGEDGLRGPQGLPGDNGKDGTTTYTWVRYADTPTSGMENFPEGKKYIGLAFNQTTQTESDNYSDYQWSLMPQNIEIGVRNLILDSKTPAESSEYLIKEYFISEDFVENQDYTVTIKGAKSPAVDFGLWQNNDASSRGSFKHIKGDLYQLTFTSVTTTVGNERRVRIYQPPSESAGKATIEWIKMVRGDYSSLDWTSAPEDVQSEIDEKANNSDLDETIRTIETESEKIASLRTDVDITKNNFLITHTDEYVNKITTTESSVNGLVDRVVEVEQTKEDIDSYFRFDDAFTIGKSNAQKKLRMTNEEFQFLDGATKGTYITGNTMVSQNAQIQDKFNLPKHTMETEGDITVVRFTGDGTTVGYSYKLVESFETIPFTTRRISDDTIPKGQEITSVTGRDGRIKVTKQVEYLNGVPTGVVTEVSRVTETEMIQRVIRVGTKEESRTLISGALKGPVVTSFWAREYTSCYYVEFEATEINATYTAEFTRSDAGLVGWAKGAGLISVSLHLTSSWEFTPTRASDIGINRFYVQNATDIKVYKKD